MSASSIGPTTDSGDRANPRARIARPFVCPLCGKVFKSDNELNLHKSLDHKPKKFVLIYEGYSLPTIAACICTCVQACALTVSRYTSMRQSENTHSEY